MNVTRERVNEIETLVLVDFSTRTDRNCCVSNTSRKSKVIGRNSIILPVCSSEYFISLDDKVVFFLEMAFLHIAF